jgi:hypothetical protein
MTDFRPKIGDRSAMAPHEAQILAEKVLPTARKWAEIYQPGTPLCEHAKQTLRYWGEIA